MFNLNEDNRIVMAQHPTDMRKGVNTLCGEVRRVGLDPTNGDVYIFVGKSRKVMKLLHRGRQPSQMAHARLGEDQAGHGREPNCGIAAIQLRVCQKWHILFFPFCIEAFRKIYRYAAIFMISVL